MIVFKDIYEVEDVESEMDFKLIEEVGEEAFYSLWNEATGEPVAHDQFVHMMLQEIGEQWKEHCLTADVDEKPIGIVIPHIERGTLEEGNLCTSQLLQICVIRDMKSLFAGAMFVLKEIGASYYIGETNMQNEWMKDVLKRMDVSRLVQLRDM